MREEKVLKYTTHEPTVFKCAEDLPMPGAKHGPVIRDCYTLECNVDGYGSVMINGKSFTVSPRTFYILFPNQVVTHACDIEKPRKGYFCHIGGLNVANLIEATGITPENPFAPKGTFFPLLEEIIEIHKSMPDKSRSADIRRTGCFYKIVSILTPQQKPASQNVMLQKALGVIGTSYAKIDSVSNLASAIGFDRSYFTRIFKESTGMSPHSYLNTVKIENACFMLRNTSMTVLEIADYVGIQPRNFSRIFKKEMYMTPQEYRETHKAKNNQ